MIPYLIDKDFDLQRLVDADGKLICDSNGLDIYVQNPSPSVPTDHGVGVLYDTTYCKATHELNGEDEIELRYPVDGALFDKLELRAVIVARVDRVRGNQPYRIYRITKPINGIVTVYARHLAYDLAGIVVEPFTASGIQAALSGLKTHAMTNCPFTFSTTRTTTANFSVNVPSSIWSLMGGQQGSLLDVYGGEYTFDGYNVSLENHVGSDRGVSVRYGVNMTDLEQDANCADCYTGVVAYWQKEEVVVYSPVVSAAGSYGYVKILSVDMSDKWEEQPTVDQLAAAASTYITSNQVGIPKVSWKVGFVPLDMTEEYKNIAALEQVSLGDSVGVKFAKLGVDAKARVNKVEWNVLLDRYISVSLGSVKANIADTIARQTQEIAKVPTTQQVTDLAAQISKTLTNAILGAEGGSVRFLDTNGDGEPDTLYIADNPDPAQAVNVWRFNYQGWGASSNGYNGPFTLGATIDGGLMANFITAGVLNANNVIVKSSGDVGNNFGNCSVQMNGQFIEGIQESATKTLWKLGSIVTQDGQKTLANGDIKLYASGTGVKTDPVIEVGGMGNMGYGFGIILHDPYTGYSGHIDIVTSDDFGPSIFVFDGYGNQVFSLGETGYTTWNSADRTKNITMNNSTGEISCERLVVNGVDMTPTP